MPIVTCRGRIVLSQAAESSNMGPLRHAQKLTRHEADEQRQRSTNFQMQLSKQYVRLDKSFSHLGLT